MRMTHWNKDGDKLWFFCFLLFFFLWRGCMGLNVSDGKIKDSSSSEFLLLICLTQDSSGTSSLQCQNPVREKQKSLSFNAWVGGEHKRVRLCMWFCAWSFCIGNAVWYFDSNDVWPFHKLTENEGENENKNGRQGKRKKWATELERGGKNTLWRNSGHWRILFFLGLSCSVHYLHTWLVFKSRFAGWCC